MRKEPNFNKELFNKHFKKNKNRFNPLEGYMSFMTAIRLILFIEMIFAVISYIVLYNLNLTWEHWLPITILVVGFLVTFWVVNRVSKSVKLSDVYDRHLNSNDVDDIILKEQEKKKNENS